MIRGELAFEFEVEFEVRQCDDEPCQQMNTTTQQSAFERVRLDNTLMISQEVNTLVLI